MLKKILTLAFCAALAVFASAWLSGAAQAGPSSVCGDGNIEGEEECDDSNTVTGDGCSFPSCLPEVCGDTTINPDPPSSEECDDGNTAAGDGCDATCQLECGNGTLEGAEECDDSGESATCDDDCTFAVCGDGNENTTAGETCDDGNTADGDGCSATCQGETLPQTKGQQGCINAVNKNLAGVAKAQNGDNSRCVKEAAAGKTPIASCIGLDTKGKVGKAGAKTTKTTTGKKCTAANVPGFAFTSDTTVNAAGEDEVLESATNVFGAAPAIADKKLAKDDAKCQAEVLKQHNAVLDKWLAAANKAKKSTLKGGKGGTPPPAPTASALATGIDSGVAADTALAKAESKANTNIAKKCLDGQVDALFDCGGATTVNGLTLCVIASAKEAACNALEAADDLDLTCPSDI